MFAATEGNAESAGSGMLSHCVLLCVPFPAPSLRAGPSKEKGKGYINSSCNVTQNERDRTQRHLINTLGKRERPGPKGEAETEKENINK